MTKAAYNILEGIFTNQITVLNIAVPITPLNLNLTKKLCLKHNYDIHLVKEPKTENLQVYVKETDALRALNESEVISESTPLIDVIDLLCQKEHVFVKVKRNITHLVTRSDLDSIPVRIWLFGMISLFEIGLKEKIQQLGIVWKGKLAPERYELAEELYSLKKSRNEEINLLGCVHLIDVGSIIFKTLDCFKDIFPLECSKKNLKSTFNKINLLRDALAHGQKLQIEWGIIHKLMQLISYSLGRI